MKNDFLTHKFLPVLSVFLLALFTLCTSVFASTDVTFSDDTVVTLPYLPEGLKSDYMVLKFSNSSGNSYNVITYNSSEGQLLNVVGYPGMFVFVDSNNNLVSCVDVYFTNDDKINSDFSYSTYNTSTASFNFGSAPIAYYSTKDIYQTAQSSDPYYPSDTLVFQGAPQVQPIQQTQLSQIVEQAKPEEVMKEITGILPIVIVVIVGLIGLWKALQFLFNLLRKA